MICNSSDGDCGEAECDTGSDYQYYGPPACQRMIKNLNLTELLDKEKFIQAYLVSGYHKTQSEHKQTAKTEYELVYKRMEHSQPHFLPQIYKSLLVHDVLCFRNLTITTQPGRISALESVVLVA